MGFGASGQQRGRETERQGAGEQMRSSMTAGTTRCKEQGGAHTGGQGFKGSTGQAHRETGDEGAQVPSSATAATTCCKQRGGCKQDALKHGTLSLEP